MAVPPPIIDTSVFVSLRPLNREATTGRGPKDFAFTMDEFQKAGCQTDLSSPAGGIRATSTIIVRLHEHHVFPCPVKNDRSQ